MKKRFIVPTIVSIIPINIAIALSLLPLSGGGPPPDIIPILPGVTLSDILLTMILKKHKIFF